jgi:hypothetical protein
MSQTRRLAAMLAADVAGYSRLMGADEEGTLERLEALRRDLVDPKIAEHHGRIVKTTGGELLVELTASSLPFKMPAGCRVPKSPLIERSCHEPKRIRSRSAGARVIRFFMAECAPTRCSPSAGTTCTRGSWG